MVRLFLSERENYLTSMAKGSSDSNNKKAIKLQQQSMAQSRKDSLRIEAIMKQQAQAAESQVLPKFEGAAAQPTQTTADMEAAIYERRLSSRRKQGLNNTVFAGAGNVRAGSFGGGGRLAA